MHATIQEDAHESKVLRQAKAYFIHNRIKEALQLCETILEKNPDQPEALYISAMAAHRAGQNELAFDLLSCAIRSDSSNPVYLTDLGLVLQSLGQHDNAIQCYQNALSIKPDFAPAHNNLGTIIRLFDPKKAIDHFKTALKHDPKLVIAAVNLGNLLKKEKLHQEAITYYRQALSMQPDHVDAHVGLADALFDLGKFDEAYAATQLALKYDPNNVSAWVLQANLSSGKVDHSWLQTAKQYLARELSPDNTVDMLFALGKYYDCAKEYDLAFEAYHNANRLKHQHIKAFDRASHKSNIDNLIRTYTFEFISNLTTKTNHSKLPVLVCGMPRSGTSLTEQIIASHPQAFGAGELIFLNLLASNHLNDVLLGQLNDEFMQKHSLEYENYLRSFSHDAKRIVDKMPGNFHWLGLFHCMFPNGKIIHVRRNPTDTCLSIYFQNFSPLHSYAFDLEDLAFYYQEYKRLMTHWRQALPPECWLEIDYEQLTEDLEGWSRKIIEFLELPWDAQCLDFHKTERRVQTASNWQVRQKIYQTSKERWKNYENHIKPLVDLIE